MPDFAQGGYVGPVGKPILLEGSDYIIPKAFAEAWAKSLLEKLNEGVDSPDEDGVE